MWPAWIVNLILLCITSIKADDSLRFTNGLQELCDAEQFEASCKVDEVIFMTHARYGRMKFGRCVQQDYGYLGCEINVLPIMDKWCSGRRKCSVPIPNHAFKKQLIDEKSIVCPNDLKPYLEASYTCIKVELGPLTLDSVTGKMNSKNKPLCKEAGTIRAAGVSGYLAKLIAEEHEYGNTDCPWRIQVPQGQRINITLFDFNSGMRDNNVHKPICKVTVTVKEIGQTRAKTICERSNRETQVYLSVGNSLDIRFMGYNKEDSGFYLIHYAAVGCPTPDEDADTWVKRRGNVAAEVGCRHDDRVWKLKCLGQKWDTEVGNCSIEALHSEAGRIGEVVLGSMLMPFEVSVIIIIIIAVAIGVIILTLGLVCLRWRLSKRPNNAKKDDQKSVLPSNKYIRNNRYLNGEPAPPGDRDDDSITENEYAYIDDFLPPTQPTHVPVPETPARGNQHQGVIKNTMTSSPARSQASRQTSFGSFRPSNPSGQQYEHSHVQYNPKAPGSPRHNVSVSSSPARSHYNHVPVTPKLMAHECALVTHRNGAVPTSSYAACPSACMSQTSSACRARDTSHNQGPTYFELDPDREKLYFGDGTRGSYAQMADMTNGHNPTLPRGLEHTPQHNGFIGFANQNLSI